MQKITYCFRIISSKSYVAVWMHNFCYKKKADNFAANTYKLCVIKQTSLTKLFLFFIYMYLCLVFVTAINIFFIIIDNKIMFL